MHKNGKDKVKAAFSGTRGGGTRGGGTRGGGTRGGGTRGGGRLWRGWGYEGRMGKVLEEVGRKQGCP